MLQPTSSQQASKGVTLIKMDVVVPVNLRSVAAATVVCYILGALWFGPLFSEPWIKASGFSKTALQKDVRSLPFLSSPW